MLYAYTKFRALTPMNITSILELVLYEYNITI